ncbi:MAG: hypothetical protein D6693_04025 [Planctomycetota bacterium]|nr:MAG: hypothetical protein D6693_04025 [Planctomycetota bacterium]
MARKVNVKFIVALAAVLLVAFTGVAWVAYEKLTTSGAEFEARGDAAAAEGDFERASRYYAHAVSREPTNVARRVKFRDAILKVIPESQVKYQQYYRDFYVNSLQALAALQESDPDAQRAYFETQFRDLAEFGASPESWLAYLNQLSTTIERLGDRTPGAKALRGLRAMAQLARSGQVELPDEDLAQIEADLRLAIEGQPDSVEFADAMIKLRVAQWRRAVRSRREATADAAYQQVEDEIAAQIERLGERPLLALRGLQARMEKRITDIPDPAQRLRALVTLKPEGRALVSMIQAADPASLDLLTLDGAYNTLRVLLEREGVEALTPVMQAAADAQPLNTRLRILHAEALKSLQDWEGVLAEAEAILAIPDQPVSREGLILYGARREALFRAAEASVFLADDADTADQRRARLAQAEAYRDRLQEELGQGEDARAVMMIDARLALARGDNRGALERLSALNEAAGGSDATVVRLLAETLRRNNLLGAAKEQFERLVEANPVDLASLAALADIEWRLGDSSAAERRYQAILLLQPDNEAVKERLAQLAKERGEAPPSDSRFASDAVAQALVEWRALMREDPPDPEGALLALTSQLAEHGDDPRLHAALAFHYATIDDRDAALRAVEAGLAVAPDDARLQQMHTSLLVSDPDASLEARLAEIDNAGLGEPTASLAKADLYRENGQSDRAAQTLAALGDEFADHPGVIERRFSWALEDGDLDAARAAAADAGRLNIDRVDGLLYDARVLMVEGKFDQALTALRDSVDRIPYDPLALRLLGQTLLRLGRVSEAVDALADAYNAKPDDALTGRLYAETLARLNRMDQALRVARAVHRLTRGDAALNELWLTLEGEAGDRDLAIAERTRRFRENPDNVRNATTLARVLMADKRFEDARPIIDDLRARRPDDESIALVDADWHALTGDAEAGASILRGFTRPDDGPVAVPVRIAQFYLRHGRTNEARAILEEARPSQPADRRPVDLLLADIAFERGEYASAVDLYRSFLEVRESPEARRRVADALIRLERFDEAIAAIDAMPPDDRDDPRAIILRARAQTGAGDEQAAAVTLDQGVREHPSSAVLFSERALHTAQHTEQFEDALADLERAVALAPTLVEARRLRILLLVQTGRLREALTEAQDAIAMIPDDPGLRETLIELYVRAGERDRAIDAAQAAAEAFPNDSGWLVTAGDLAATASRWNQALDFYQRAYDRDRQARIAVRLAQSYLTVDPPRPDEVAPLLEPYFDGDHRYRSTVRLLAAQAADARGRRGRALELADEAFAVATTHADIRDWFTGVPDLFETTRDFVAFAREHTPPADLAAAYTVLLAKAEITDPARVDSLVVTLRDLDVSDADPLTRLDRIRLLGQLLYATDQFEEADRVYVEGLALAPEDLEFNNNLAYLRVQRLDDAAGALGPAETAARLAPTDSNVLDTLGLVYTRLGRLEEAGATLLKAAETATTTTQRVPAYLHLALALEAQGDAGRARRYAEQALSLLRSAPGLQDEYAPQLAALMERLDSTE